MQMFRWNFQEGLQAGVTAVQDRHMRDWWYSRGIRVDKTLASGLILRASFNRIRDLTTEDPAGADQNILFVQPALESIPEGIQQKFRLLNFAITLLEGEGRVYTHTERFGVHVSSEALSNLGFSLDGMAAIALPPKAKARLGFMSFFSKSPIVLELVHKDGAIQGFDAFAATLRA